MSDSQSTGNAATAVDGTATEGRPARAGRPALVKRLMPERRRPAPVGHARETSDRRFNGAQIIVVELEILDPLEPDSPRIIVYDHVFGPATARRWRPGRDIPIWIDPRDPERIYAGR